MGPHAAAAAHLARAIARLILNGYRRAQELELCPGNRRDSFKGTQNTALNGSESWAKDLNEFRLPAERTCWNGKIDGHSNNRRAYLRRMSTIHSTKFCET
jgi:hypothetical protein